MKPLSEPGGCEALDQHGRRCRRPAPRRYKLHLNNELYEYPSWVTVALCVKHQEKWAPRRVRRIRG